MRRVVIGVLIIVLIGALLSVVGRLWHALPPSYRPPVMSALEAKARRFCEEKGATFPLRQPSVEIHKAQRILHLYEGRRLLAEFPIALGSRPQGDKEREGDRKTPEDSFYICEKHYSPRFYLFLGLSYPAPDDAERGKLTGLIDQSQYRAILKAHREGTCPPWDTPLGGAIGIHGGGTHRDWTLGCIAVDNAHIELLYALLPVGTRVRIDP